MNAGAKVARPCTISCGERDFSPDTRISPEVYGFPLIVAIAGTFGDPLGIADFSVAALPLQLHPKAVLYLARDARSMLN